MNHEEILRELASLPPEGQEKAAEFIASLREYYARQSSRHNQLDLATWHFSGYGATAQTCRIAVSG
jgi:hypothetical protein